MKLQGRNLQPNTRGDDVKLLQSELRRLGFDVAETDGFFDSTLFLAVKAFQRRHGINPVDGLVDDDTARVITRAVAERDVERWVVLGDVLQEDGGPVEGASVRAFAKILRRDTPFGEDSADRGSDDTDHLAGYLLTSRKPVRSTSALENEAVVPGRMTTRQTK